MPSETEVEGINPNGGQLRWYPPLRHLRQRRFLFLALNSLSRIALVNRIGPYLFLPGLKGKKSKKVGLQCHDDPIWSVQSHMIILPTAVWKLQIMLIFAVIPDGTTNMSLSRCLSGSRLQQRGRGFPSLLVAEIILEQRGAASLKPLWLRKALDQDHILWVRVSNHLY